MSNQEKYNTLRKTYPEFVYETYHYNVQPDGLHIVFSFSVGEHRFQPQSFIPARTFLQFDQPGETMDALVFNIGMIELISYWKCACPPVVKVRCGVLDDTQKAFWRKLYWHGLGEFLYINGIAATPDSLLTIDCPADAPRHAGIPPIGHSGKDYLVPIGGGKDSIVTLELLRAAQLGKVVPLIMNPRGATVGCIQAAGYTMDDVLEIRRTIDPHLLELNAQGFLNGHTPFSAMLAFYTLLAAQLSGIPGIALSNENSANESTVVGTEVNHQYSKSLEFENDFRAYVARYLSPDYNYFSFLRPLTELHIAMLFSRYGKYHPVFRSCNVGSKQDIWCGHCAKCLFAYIILGPFIDPDRLNAIFGKNMLDDTTLRHEFDQLIGRAKTKPFECVGTVSEVNRALSMTLARWYADKPLPALLTDYLPNPSIASLPPVATEHNLNETELSLLLKAI